MEIDIFDPKKRRLMARDMKKIERLGTIERIVTMVLEQKTYTEIGKQLGISNNKVGKLVKTPEFEQAMREAIRDVTRDPRRKMAIQFVVDLLPVANRRLEEALLADDVPWTVRQWAIKMIYEMAHIGDDMGLSEEDELRKFLQSARNVTINVADNQVVLSNAVDPDYLNALRATEIVDGAVHAEGDDIVEGDFTPADGTD